MKRIIHILLLLVPILGYPQQHLYKSSLSDCIWQYAGNPGFSAGIANYSNIAVHPVTEQPCVVYVDLALGTGNIGPATVMQFDGTGWVSVGNPGFTGTEVGYPNLAFSPEAVPYVAYGSTCSTPNQATVMKFFDGSWVLVGTGGFSQGETAYTTLAFSPSGQPYVVFLDMANSNKTTVMKFDGTSWVNVGTPGFSSGEAWYENIGFSASGDLYISYWDFPSESRAAVMKFNGTDWECVGTSFCAEGCSQNPSLAIDPTDGQPCLAYTDNNNGYKATVIKFDGSNWVKIGNAGLSTGYASAIKLAFSPSGQPYIFYWDNYLTNSVVKKFDGAGWVDVGDPGFTGGYITYTGMAFSPSGAPYVVYQDYINSDKASVMKYDFPVGSDENKGSQFTLYPNPATDLLNIDLAGFPGQNKVLEIHNVQGKLMSAFQTSEDKFRIDTRSYPAGMYVLTVQSGDLNRSFKFCKN
jgi:hypothetical protein